MPCEEKQRKLAEIKDKREALQSPSTEPKTIDHIANIPEKELDLIQQTKLVYCKYISL